MVFHMSYPSDVTCWCIFFVFLFAQGEKFYSSSNFDIKFGSAIEIMYMKLVGDIIITIQIKYRELISSDI